MDGGAGIAEQGAAGIAEQRIEVDGVGVQVRRSDGEGTPVVFSHGNPTDSGDWIPFLERLGRPGIAFDLPGWGRSQTPPPDQFDYSMHGLARFFGRCLEALGIEQHALVVHDWGAVALIDALARSRTPQRLVVIDAVPLLPGYRWHWIARWFWRRPIAGELFNLAATKSAFRLISRQANATPGPMPEEFVDSVWEHWRPGTGRPVLDLYRSGDPEALAAAGAGLGALGCPALVVWGRRDPYIDARFGRAYAARLGAELLELPAAGHWPWLDQPGVVERVVAFLDAG